MWKSVENKYEVFNMRSVPAGILPSGTEVGDTRYFVAIRLKQLRDLSYEGRRMSFRQRVLVFFAMDVNGNTRKGSSRFVSVIRSHVDPVGEIETE